MGTVLIVIAVIFLYGIADSLPFLFDGKHRD